MEYVTQLVGRTVYDVNGERFGKIAEVVVTPSEPLPVVAACQVKTEDGAFFVPWSFMRASADSRQYTLSAPITEVTPYQIKEHDFSLLRDVLDKQIVDMHDFRVVRVNDIRLQLLPNGQLALLGVDAGVGGLIRRLGLQGAFGKIGELLHLAPPQGNVISWHDVESLPMHNAGEPIKLKVSHEKIGKLHPADIADILNQVDPAHRHEILESLDIETAAGALAEADEDVQVSALKHMDGERAADILEEMGADEAADVLGDMDRAHRDDLLGRMDPEDREEVEELLEYHDRTAGGLMTNEFVAIRRDLTAQQTIDRLRELEPEAETIYYIYVIDEAERLVGVISLRDLIISHPDTLIETFMKTEVKRLNVDASVEDVARRFERYKLLALPVVDEDDVLQGIVTIDDTLEEFLPPDWRRHAYRRSSEETRPA